MEIVLAHRRVLKGQTTRLETAVSKHDTQPLSEVEIKQHLETVGHLRAACSQLEYQFAPLCSDDQFVVEEIEFGKICDRLLALKVKLVEISPIQTPPVGSLPSTSVARTNSVKLPKLDLPTFDGHLPDWMSFHDLFTATVHKNESLSGAQKLQYLKASLKGDAAKLIQSVQVTDVNYAEAWDILLARYQNKREIINAQLKRMFNQPAIQQESSINLRKLLDTTTECVRALRVLGLSTDQWDPLLVYLVTERLDCESRRQWELSLKGDAMPSFDDLSEFLNQRARALAAAGMSTAKSVHIQKQPEATKKQITSVHYIQSKPSCVNCSGEHYLNKCDNFQKMTILERRQVVQKHSLCFNCLDSGHNARQCKRGVCRKCQAKHNTLVHLEDVKENPELEPIPLHSTIATHFTSGDGGKVQVLLSTAIIKVCNATGQQLIVRALLDSASEASFISENCAQKLGIKSQRTRAPISGIGQAAAGTARGYVQLKISSLVTDFTTNVEALILPKVTGNLPHSKCDISTWSHITGIKLADPKFNEPGPVDILLGADVYFELMQCGQLKGPEGSAIACQSVLGWVLGGRIVSTPNTNRILVHHGQIELDTALKRFWELEELRQVKLLTPEEQLCENHFTKTHRRDQQGRYIVQLPLIHNELELGSSREMAIRRFKQVERRLSAAPHQHDEYIKFMREYESLGHMELISADAIESMARTTLSKSPVTYHIPHHFVLKDSSTTTKFRVVFDASAKTSTGVSLNDKLAVGPKLQDDLFPILLRFRTHTIALSADIGKMYRQVLVDQSQTDLQRIAWRESPDVPLKFYRLRTVTYGTASAPYLATKCIQQLAADEGKSFPVAAPIAHSDFYVDDLLSGASDRESAIVLQDQLIQMLKCGGFDLRKWSSNDQVLLESLPIEYRETQVPLNLDLDESIKTLGIRWNPASDNFTFVVNVPESRPIVTKRSLLSDLAKVFDPLGWLAPVTIKGKIIFQQLWLLPLTWDDPLPSRITAQWTRYCDEIQSIESIQIPRRITTTESKSCELHGFCDASQDAYSAVVYTRNTLTNGQIFVYLVTAKTKVSPIKQVSIPRLELCGAVLLANLLKIVEKALKIDINGTHAWTDSTTVLDWLATHPIKWKTFVANRVSEIQDLIAPSQWHHVKGEDNPADCASRGFSPLELHDHKLWWNGPDWLRQSEIKHQPHRINRDQKEEEKKPKLVVAHSILVKSLLNKFSSLSTLKRVTAYCRRFVHNARRPKSDRTRGFLTRDELQSALLSWIKFVQHTEFPDDVMCCVKGTSLPKKSPLLTLNPFMDKDGVLRVGGRLEKASISVDQKHPIVLPRRNSLTDLIINYFYLTNLHAGPQLLLAVIQQQFWIICGRDTIRHFVRRCVVCHRHRAETNTQMMGSLPSARVNPSPAFLQSGVDYAGPYLLRVVKGRGHKMYKAYISIFICFVTHGIHLELVSDLSSYAFIAALKRFIARRGKCSDLFSDCGTNFVGANKELKEFMELMKSSKHNEVVSHYLTNEGTNWHFNPPASPHFGGLWEAGVKSVKFHLKRIMGNANLNFEEMTTMLCQIESCLNSRPLSPLSADPSDLSALTPGHFLIGRPLTSIPEPDYTTIPINRLSRWQLTQQLFQHFWKRWSHEYLSRLQQRPKWAGPKPNLKEDDLVLIKEDNTPPLKWRLGRVLKLHPGKDNYVRVVTVKTSDGELKRPIVKLSLLPMDK